MDPWIFVLEVTLTPQINPQKDYGTNQLIASLCGNKLRNKTEGAFSTYPDMLLCVCVKKSTTKI